MSVMSGSDSPRIRPPRRIGRTTRLAAGLALAALLVGGGSVLGAHLAASGSGQPARARLASNNAPMTSRGAWDSLLGGAGLGGTGFGGAQGWISTAGVGGGPVRRAHLAIAVSRIHRCVAVARQLRARGHLAAARAMLRLCLRGYLRLRLALLGAIHGQLTFSGPRGTRTIAFERGVIKTASSGSIVVVAPDGTTMTWDLVGKTAIVQARHRVGASALAAQEHVLVLGQVVGGTDDARLIVIHR
jgi:PPE-repeat protein